MRIWEAKGRVDPGRRFFSFCQLVSTIDVGLVYRILLIGWVKMNGNHTSYCSRKRHLFVGLSIVYLIYVS